MYSRRRDFLWTALAIAGAMLAIYASIWRPRHQDWLIFLAIALNLPGTIEAVIRMRVATRTALRIKEGRCVNCNYDLCKSPDRCPECGQVIPKRVELDKQQRLESL